MAEADNKENEAATATPFASQAGFRSACASPPLSAQHSLSLQHSLESAASLGSLTRLPSLDILQPYGSASKASAKQLCMRLMHAATPREIFDLATSNVQHLDSINITAALQRLAKQLDSQPPAAKEAVLESPVLKTLAEMLVDECNAGRMNSQSTANAWWAVSKLLTGGHPLAGGLLLALEAALMGCLASPCEVERPNPQAISSIFYAWGRLEGYLPTRAVLALVWDRTLSLSLNFDCQGVANILWSLGAMKKKHGEAFAIRTDVLAALTFLVKRIVPSFAVQGLSCAAVGCANMGPLLRGSVLPLMETLVKESLKRPTNFTMQAMSNMVAAIARIGPMVFKQPETQLLLAAFDAHAASLPPPHKSQEVHTLLTSFQKCGYHSRRFQGVGRPAAPPQPPLQSPFASAAAQAVAALAPPALQARTQPVAVPLQQQAPCALPLHDADPLLLRQAAAAAAAPTFLGGCSTPFGATAQPWTAAGITGYELPMLVHPAPQLAFPVLGALPAASAAAYLPARPLRPPALPAPEFSGVYTNLGGGAPASRHVPLSRQANLDGILAVLKQLQLQRSQAAASAHFS